MPSLPQVHETLRAKLVEVFGSKIEPLPDLAWKEQGLCFSVQAKDAKAIFEKLKSCDDLLFDMLIDVTAVDWLDRRESRFDVVYQLLSTKHLHRLTIKIAVDEANPEVESVVSLWNSANFLEREVWDMFGIVFKNHGDLRRILMYDEFVGHPLRKDYPKNGKQPRVPLRIPELRNTSADMHRDELVQLRPEPLKVGK